MKISAIWAMALAVCISGPASADAELAESPSQRRVEVAAPAASNEPRVARAIITTAIENREPVDSVESLQSAQSLVFFFSELLHLEGATVTHRWERDGETLAEVPFQVGSPRWRVWSSKNLRAEWTGQWSVKVVGSDGAVLGEASFSYEAAEADDPS